MSRFFVAIFILTTAGFAFANPVSSYAPQTAASAGGRVLKWHSKEIVVSISDSFLQNQFEAVPRKELLEILRSSFQKWANEADLRIRFRIVKKTDISSHASGGDGVSLITAAPTAANMLLFGEGKTNQSAVTRLFFDAKGNITEADIVLNPTARFTANGSRGSFDIGSTVTHEAGHFLGLGHSKIVSATMYKHLGVNGTFDLPATSASTLSEDDKSGIRELYGHKKKGRFGSVRGTVVSDSSLGKLLDTHVVLESKKTGKVIAGIETDKNGVFRFGSIPVGSYIVHAADENGVIVARSDEDVQVTAGRLRTIELTATSPTADVRISSFGFNGRISKVGVPLEAGHAYVVYLQSESFDPEQLRISCSSPGISVDNTTLTFQYLKGKKSVYSVEVFVAAGTPKGDYSLRLYEEDSIVSDFPGVLTIDDVVNPWYSALF